jgi:hypothetical protein
VYELGPTSAYKQYDPSESQALVASSTTLAGLQPYINAMTACMNSMNAENLPYPFLGLGANSNSVASTMDACMGVPEPFIPNSAPITPGVGTLLLPTSTITGIQQANGLTQTSMAGDNAVSSASIGATTSTVNVTNSNGTTEAATITTSGGAGDATLITKNSAGTTDGTETDVIQPTGAEAITANGILIAAPVAANDATIGTAAYGSASIPIYGINDTINSGSRLQGHGAGLEGSNDVLSGTGDLVTGSDANVTLLNASDTVKFDSSFGTVNAVQSGDVVDLGNGLDQATNLTNDVITAGSGVVVNGGYSNSAIVKGNGVSIGLGSLDTLDLQGTSDTIISNASTNNVIDIAAGQTVNVDVSGITIVGAGSDTINVTGTNDKIYADSSTIEVNGTDTGDVIHGTGDTGDPSNWGGYYSQSGGYGGYGGGGYYDAIKSIKSLPKQIRSMSGGIRRTGAADIAAIGASDHGPQIILGRQIDSAAASGNSTSGALVAAATENRTTAIDTIPVTGSATAQNSVTANTAQLMADQLVHAMATWPTSTMSPMFSPSSNTDDTAASQFLTRPLVSHAQNREHAHAA